MTDLSYPSETVLEGCTESSYQKDLDPSPVKGCRSVSRRSSMPLNGTTELAVASFKAQRRCSIQESLPPLSFQTPQNKKKPVVTRWEGVEGQAATTSSGTYLRSNFRALTKSPSRTVWQLPQVNSSETPEWMKKLKSKTGGGGKEDDEVSPLEASSKGLDEAPNTTELKKAVEISEHDANSMAHDTMPEWKWKRKLMEIKSETLMEMRRLTDQQSESSIRLDNKHGNCKVSIEAVPSENKQVVLGNSECMEHLPLGTPEPSPKERQHGTDDHSTPWKRCMLNNRLVQAELLALGQKSKEDLAPNNHETGVPEIMRKFQTMGFERKTVVEAGGRVTKNKSVVGVCERQIAASKSDPLTVSSMRTSSPRANVLSSNETDLVRRKLAKSAVDQAACIESFNSKVTPLERESKLSSLHRTKSNSTPIVMNDFVQSGMAEETEVQLVTVRSGGGDHQNQMISKEHSSLLQESSGITDESPSDFSGRSFLVNENGDSKSFPDKHSAEETHCQCHPAPLTTELGEGTLPPKVKKKKKKNALEGEKSLRVLSGSCEDEDPSRLLCLSEGEATCSDRQNGDESTFKSAAAATTEPIASEKRKTKKKVFEDVDLQGGTTDLIERQTESTKMMHESFNSKEESPSVPIVEHSKCESSVLGREASSSTKELVNSSKVKKKKKAEVDEDLPSITASSEMLHESFNSKDEPLSVQSEKVSKCESKTSRTATSSSSGELISSPVLTKKKCKKTDDKEKIKNTLTAFLENNKGWQPEEKPRESRNRPRGSGRHGRTSSRDESVKQGSSATSSASSGEKNSSQSHRKSRRGSKTSSKRGSGDGDREETASPDKYRSPQKQGRSPRRHNSQRSADRITQRPVKEDEEEEEVFYVISRNTEFRSSMPKITLPMDFDEFDGIADDFSTMDHSHVADTNKERKAKEEPFALKFPDDLKGEAKVEEQVDANPFVTSGNKSFASTATNEFSAKDKSHEAQFIAGQEGKNEELFAAQFENGLERDTKLQQHGDADPFVASGIKGFNGISSAFSTMDNNHLGEFFVGQEETTRAEPFTMQFENDLESGAKVKEHVDADPFISSGNKGFDGIAFENPFRESSAFGESFGTIDGSEHGSGLSSVFGGSGSRLSAAFSDSFVTGNSSRLSAAFGESFGTGDNDTIDEHMSGDLGNTRDHSFNAAFGDSFVTGEGQLGNTRVHLNAGFDDSFVAADGSRLGAVFGDSFVTGDGFGETFRTGDMNFTNNETEFGEFGNIRNGGDAPGRMAGRNF